MIQVGETLPDNTLYILKDEVLDSVTVHEIFAEKKVVIFGLPGAFTSVCSSKQVPQFYEKLGEIQENCGMDVYCVSVNDPYVMEAWAKDLNVDVSKMVMLSDGDASWHKKMGLTQELEALGTRALRYSMVVDNLIVTDINCEEEGGKNYTISGPQTILEKHGQSGESKKPEVAPDLTGTQAW